MILSVVAQSTYPGPGPSLCEGGVDRILVLQHILALPPSDTRYRSTWLPRVHAMRQPIDLD